MNKTICVESSGAGPKRARRAPMPVWTCAIILALAGAGCATISSVPKASKMQSRDGGQKAVLLLRVITEVEGKSAAAFPSSVLPWDMIAFGVGDFSSGGQIKPAILRFLSAESREQGWAYLLLEQGQVYYLAAHEPISTSPDEYNARWAVCPRWSVELPINTRVVYGGTLYLPGTGRWMLFTARNLVTFDRQRIEVRDESTEAEQVAKQWLSALGPMSVHLARKWEPGETVIIQTPTGK